LILQIPVCCKEEHHLQSKKLKQNDRRGQLKQMQGNQLKTEKRQVSEKDERSDEVAH
jgi:hypothetical protein